MSKLRSLLESLLVGSPNYTAIKPIAQKIADKYGTKPKLNRYAKCYDVFDEEGNVVAQVYLHPEDDRIDQKIQVPGYREATEEDIQSGVPLYVKDAELKTVRRYAGKKAYVKYVSSVDADFKLDDLEATD